MVPDHDVSVVLRGLLDTDPEYGVVLLTPGCRVLYSNLAARSHLRDGTPRSREDALLPETLDRVLRDFVTQAQAREDALTVEVHYPNERNRRLRIMLEMVKRERNQYVVLRTYAVTPWAEPTVRRLQSRFGLTVREAQVAVIVARGYSNREVAEQLGIVEKSVKNVLMLVYQKCVVRNRSELALRAYDAPVGQDDEGVGT